MRDYNGFTGAERALGGNLLRKLFQLKGNYKKGACVLCHTTGVITHTHQENYYEFYNFWELCIPCHMNLHNRQKDPVSWKIYCELAMLGLVQYVLGSEQFTNILRYFPSEFNRRYKDLPRTQVQAANVEDLSPTPEQLFLWSLGEEIDYRNNQIDIYGEDYLQRLSKEVITKRNHHLLDSIILNP